MPKHIAGGTVLMLLAAVVAGVRPSAAHAADEENAGRLREMLHRTQEALRQAQSENAELARAKSDAEQKLTAATKQLDVAQSGSKTAQASLQSKVASAEGAQADLSRKLAETSERLAAATTKLGETAKQLSERTAELAQTRQSLVQTQAANTSCEDKNAKLYTYGQEVLRAYRKKGVWASLAQKDPVFGLKDVDIQNVVQEYQLKMTAQKVPPAAQ